MSETPRQPIILCADRKSPLPQFDAAAAGIGARMVYGGATTPEAIEPLVEDADIVIVFRTPVSAAAIARMKRCRAIIRQGIGFDIVDVEAATRAGIAVTNIPDYCVEEVASHAIALLISSIRNLPGYDHVVRAKGWGMYFDGGRKAPLMSRMRLGIVGLGKIGRAAARMAKGFGFQLAGYDPYVAADVFEMMGVEKVLQLDDLLATCDAITIHAPLTPETRGMISARELGLMKKGSYLVNTARGKIVDLTALHLALSDGRIAAAGLDVFEDEPFDANHPILELPNVIATPHVAFYSEVSIQRVVDEVMEEAIRVLRGQRPLNLVNPAVCERQRKLPSEN